MPALKLLAKLVLYYAVLAAIVAGALAAFPGVEAHLPVGRVQVLLGETAAPQLLPDSLPDPLSAALPAALRAAAPASFGTSMIWLIAAVFGALLAALPVSWVYMRIRNPAEYDQSLIDTIVVLPLVVTSIVVVVQHSLALSFSLAGIAGAARYRNTLKSSGDLLFILLAIGIGLSAGIGALELALVSSAAFNLCFVALWVGNYGERRDMKRFLGEFEAEHPAGATVTTTTLAASVVTEVTEPAPTRPATPADD